MTHSYETWRIFDVPSSYVTWIIHMWHDSYIRDVFICEQVVHMWHVWCICGITHSYVTWFVHMWHDSFIHDTTHSYVDMAHSYMWHDSFMCDMPCAYVPWFIQMSYAYDSSICDERWGAGVETQKNVRGEVGGWGRVPFNEPYAPSLSTIYDGA